jgi:hypothetical protein
VIPPGQLGQVGTHPVDERVDVLGEGPGHGGMVPAVAGYVDGTVDGLGVLG